MSEPPVLPAGIWPLRLHLPAWPMDHTPSSFSHLYLPFFPFSSSPFIPARALEQQQDAIFLFCVSLNIPCCSLNTYFLLQYCIRNCPNSPLPPRGDAHVHLLGFLMVQGWSLRCSPRALKVLGCETQKRVLPARGEHVNITSRYPEHPSSCIQHIRLEGKRLGLEMLPNSSPFTGSALL